MQGSNESVLFRHRYSTPLLIRHIVPRRLLKFTIGPQSGDNLRANSFEQNEFRLGRVEQDHREGFDQPNFVDGRDDLLLFAGAHSPAREAFAGHQSIELDLVCHKSV